MRTPAEYLEAILETVVPLPTSTIKVEESIGLVTASVTVSEIALPRFDNSSMDGFAVIATDLATATKQNPITLTIAGHVSAGEKDSTSLTSGFAIQIMTGAPLPAGATAVVPIEQCNVDGDEVSISEGVAEGAYIRRVGEDVKPGQQVVGAGAVVGAREVAALSAIGHTQVLVYQRPRVAVITTGDEVVRVGQPLSQFGIYDANGPMLKAQFEAMGAAVQLHPVVPDSVEEFLTAVTNAAASNDLVITSGGISMGTRDIVKESLISLPSFNFEKIAMNPGMPQGFGRLNGTLVITLPGNPVSSYVSAEVFVRPTIQRMRGVVGPVQNMRIASCDADVSSPMNKEQYVRAIVTGSDELVVSPVGMQGSHVVSGLAAANALVRIPIGVEKIVAGQQVDIIDLREK